MALALWLINAFWTKNIMFVKGRLTSPPALLVMSIVFMIFLSTVFSKTPILNFFGSYERGQGLVQWLFYFCFFLLLLISLTSKRVKIISYLVLISGILVSIYSLFQIAGLDPIFGDFDPHFFGNRRIFATLGNPDFLAQYLAPLVPLTFFLIVEKSHPLFWKFAGIFSFLLFVAVIIFTQSRASALGLFVGIGLLALLWLKQKIGVKKVVISIIGLLLTAVVLFNISSIRNLPLINRLLPTTQNLQSLQSRIAIWDGTIDLILRNPLFGIGPDAFGVRSLETLNPKVYLFEADLNIVPDRPHNDILEYALIGGIPAMLLFLVLYGWIFKKTFNGFLKNEQFTLQRALLLGLIILFIQNLFSFSGTSHYLIFFAFLASIIALETRDVFSRVSFSYSFLSPVILLTIPFIFYFIIFKPASAEYYYTQSFSETGFDAHSKLLEKTISLNPYAGFYRWQLVMTNYHMIPRQLFMLEQIEGPSLNVLAWKANQIGDEDLSQAKQIYDDIFSIQPNNPNIVRSYGDLFFRKKLYPEAITMYERYLEIVPPLWRMKSDFDERNEHEKSQLRIFYQNVPDFDNIFIHLSESYRAIGNTEKAEYYKQFLDTK